MSLTAPPHPEWLRILRQSTSKKELGKSNVLRHLRIALPCSCCAGPIWRRVFQQGTTDRFQANPAAL
eukprot:12881232-Prorocentrum_lima.AAC.1